MLRWAIPMRAMKCLAWLVGPLVALACGGATDLGDGNDGSGGTGGTDAGSGGVAMGARPGLGGAPIGMGARPAVGGNGIGGANVGGQCAAAPVCKAGDVGYKSELACAMTPGCYPVTRCNSTIWCAPSPQCTGVPVCNAGDVQLMGPCPPDGRPECYSRSVCGATVWCLSPSGVAGSPGIGGGGGIGGVPGEGGAGGAVRTCDSSGVEHNRRYIGTSTRECQLIDYTCPSNTKGFTNDCGCGCEQESNCPPFVDCAPGGELDYLCKEYALCPYTVRAL